MKRTNLNFPGMTRRGLQTERRGEGDTATDVIFGYGSVTFREGDAGTEFWLWSDTVEHIMPGAFDRSLRDDDVRSFFNHDANIILGRRQPGRDVNTLDLSVDSVGLRYDVTPPAAHAGVIESVARGDVSGSSFMFDPTETTWRETVVDGQTVWVREITEVRLFEVGPVVWPAYIGTTADARSALSSDPLLKRYLGWLERHVACARNEFEDFRLNSREARDQRSTAMESRLAEIETRNLTP
jgi:hypothetical protein